MSQTEKQPDAVRPPAKGQKFAHGVVDHGDMVGVPGVAQTEQLSGQAQAPQQRRRQGGGHPQRERQQVQQRDYYEIGCAAAQAFAGGHRRGGGLGQRGVLGAGASWEKSSSTEDAKPR